MQSDGTGVSVSGGGSRSREPPPFCRGGAGGLRGGGGVPAAVSGWSGRAVADLSVEICLPGSFRRFVVRLCGCRSAQRPGRCVCGAAGAVTAGRIGCGAVSRDRVWKNFARGCGLVLRSARVGSLCRGAGCLRRDGSAAVPCGRAAEAGGVAGRIACGAPDSFDGRRESRAGAAPDSPGRGLRIVRMRDCLSGSRCGRDGALRQAGFAANGIQPVQISFSLRILPDAIATAGTFLETSRLARAGAEDG